MQTTHTERTERRSGLAAAMAGLTVIGLLGCGDSGPGSLEGTRTARESDPPVIAGVTPAQRYMWRPSSAEAQRAQVAPPTASAPGFTCEVPEGWERLPNTTFRHINTRVASAPNAECYLTFLQGDGGGDLPNVNRWRAEMGLAPIGLEDLVNLPRTELIGQSALLTDLVGSFTGMSGQRIPEARMLGVLLTRPNMPGALFVKFVGPTDVVTANEAKFKAFVASIGFDAGPAAHGGGASAAGATAQGSAGSGSSLTWQVPAGWTVQPGARQFRDVTLVKGESELYISVLGGGGGGLLANIDRWLKQFGRPSLGVDGLAGLERVPCLGGEAYLVAAEGPFTGMDGVQRGDMGLLGALLEQPARLVTVKLVGPAAEVRAARADFQAFVGSLRDRL